MPLLQAIMRLGQTFNEQRRSLRDHVYFPAWIKSDIDSQSYECTVLDVSDGGARIVVSSRMRVPKEFWLVLTSDGTRRRRCEIVWRSDNQVGVRYLGPVQSSQRKAGLH